LVQALKDPERFEEAMEQVAQNWAQQLADKLEALLDEEDKPTIKKPRKKRKAKKPE
jgi:hypothetical protein